MSEVRATRENVDTHFVTHKLAGVLYSQVVNDTEHQLDARVWCYWTRPVRVLHLEIITHFHKLLQFLSGGGSLTGIDDTGRDRKEGEALSLQGDYGRITVLVDRSAGKKIAYRNT